MKIFLKIIAVCIGMALVVYLEPKFIAFWLCTMGGSLKLSNDLSNFLYLICVILFFSTLIAWGIVNNHRSPYETKWMPLIIGLSLIICQFIVAGYLNRRYVDPMKANKYGHLRTHGEGLVFGLADKWGNDIVPPYYRYVTDYGDYAKLFRSNGDSIKYDFFEKRFIEFKPTENHQDDNTNLVNSHSSDNSNNGSGEAKKTQTVHVVRDPIPVQEWETCMDCMGAGKRTCDRCAGSGTIYIGDNLKSCHYCNGHGEKTCYSCGGRGGQYITVYK